MPPEKDGPLFQLSALFSSSALRERESKLRLMRLDARGRAVCAKADFTCCAYSNQTGFARPIPDWPRVTQASGPRVDAAPGRCCSIVKSA